MISSVGRFVKFVLLVGLVALAIGVTGALVAQTLDGRVDAAVLSTLGGAIGVALYLLVPWWVGRGVDRKTSGAGATGTSAYGFVIAASVLGIAGVVGLAPDATRRALAFHGDWFLGGPRSPDVLQWGRRLGERIPGSRDPGVWIDPSEATEASDPDGPLRLEDGEGTSTKAERAAPPETEAETKREDQVLAESPATATSIFQEASPAVVVIETQTALDHSSEPLFGELYRDLGLELDKGTDRASSSRRASWSPPTTSSKMWSAPG